MPKIDIDKVQLETATTYPDPFWQATVGRGKKRLGNAVGLSQFGVNLTTLKPGAWSSQRHWHRNEDEFVYVVQGEITLVEDHGDPFLRIRVVDRFDGIPYAEVQAADDRAIDRDAVSFERLLDVAEVAIEAFLDNCVETGGVGGHQSSLGCFSGPF